MIDLSADLGEGAPREDEIWPLVHSANVACGGHTGDAASMREAAQMARRLGVRLGAHPSYPDREHFGRKTMEIGAEALRATLVEQISALRDIAASEGVPLVHVKPHGALYNDAHRDRALADVVIDALRQSDPTLAIVCSDRSEMAAAAREQGIPMLREAFADRRYEADGSLVSRGKAGALLDVREAAAQARLLADEGMVIAASGERVAVLFDTICIHADMEEAVERLHAIREAIAHRLG